MLRKVAWTLSILLITMLTLAHSSTAIEANTIDSPEELVGPQTTLPPTVVNREELALGDVIVEGALRKDGTCEMNPFQMQTAAPENSNTRWLGVRLDATNCRAVVNALWEGALEEGPKDVTEPLLNLLPSSGVPYPEESKQGTVSSKNVPIAMVDCKTSQLRVFMYGYGGTGDRLTYKHGTLKFCYDGTNATISTQSGACAGSMPFSWYEWVVDGCFTINVSGGPASVVSRSGRGDYHCDPPATSPCDLSAPDGYYHSLYESEDGHADGSSHCAGWSSGDIVAGVDTEILLGCS